MQNATSGTKLGDVESGQWDELIGHLARPLSLGLRLRGNIMGDHMVLGIFNGLVPILVPVIFYGLGVFVSFIQAFVFCLLTMVYISLSTAHDH